MQAVQYNVLGTLEVVRDGERLDLGAFRQRALLALFLMSPNQVLSTDLIIDGIWGEEGGTDKQNALWVYISGLRKALEPDREPRSEGTILRTRAPGYVVTVDPDAIDAVRFERLVERGRAVAGTDPAEASLMLSEALALWRGRAYEEFMYEPFARSEIARLEGLRLEAIEARVDADLACGMSRELVSELEAMVREHPLREHFTGQLMVALYRSGRQAEALRAFQFLRSRLGEELGIEPSAHVRRLEEQILLGDEQLDTAAQPSGGGPRPGLVVRGYELRAQIGEGAFGAVYRAYQPSVGREVAVKVIRPELADDPGFIRRFEAEAQLVARLEHPHIVPLYDFWREPHAAYLVMRLMRGGNLGDALGRGGLTHHETARMVNQLAGALATAHGAGVIHRDIKPANVLVDDDGNAYLSDFGIAQDGGGARSASPSGVLTLEPLYASPEQLLDDHVDASSDVYSLGVLAAQALAGRVGPLDAIRDALPTAVRTVIDRATSSVAMDRHQDVASFAAELGAVLDGAAPSGIAREIENPFKGLRPFDAVDSGEFFGRGRLIDRLIARLGEPGTRSRFIALVGPSGSGKSSAVRAGLLPALRRGAQPGSDRWFVVEMAPAPHPFEKLEDALLGVAVDRPPGLLDLLAGSEAGLRQAVRRVLPRDGAQLLIVIDQFEELFTQVDVPTRQRFLDTLVAAVRDAHSGVRVLVTLRADFYDPPLRHRGLGELLRDGTEVITPMTPEELSSAVTGPVEPLGVTVEPALAAELVSDVVDRTGALPLLQYTLTELFEARRGSWMTVDAYRELGGVSGVVARRADGLLRGLGDRAHEVTREVFLRLVTLGEGRDDTRRRVLVSELEQLVVDGRTLGEVLDTFGRHRLLSFDRDPVTRGPTVEISHEALLTEWDRLAAWIEDARDDVRNQRRLATAMAEWSASGRADEYLLHGGLLDLLSTWAPGSSVPLSESEQAFLDASVAERERLDAQEVERERRTRDAERDAARRLRQLVGASALVVLVAGLAVFGIVQWRSASEARDANDSLVVGAEFRIASETELTRDPELALLYAVEAVRATSGLGYASEDAVDSLHWGLQQLGVQYPVGAQAESTLRSGPTGLTGVFVMPPAELVALAESSTDRRLTAAECAAITDRECPEATPIDPDLPLRFGAEGYTVKVPQVLPGVPTFGYGPLAGTRVTLAPASAVGNDAGLKLELARFTEITGIEVDVLSNRGFDLTRNLVTGEVESLPDVISYFSPPPEWAESRAIDLSAFLDTETLRADFGDYLVDLLSTESAVTGIVINAQMKGLVFYPKQAFEAAGYEVPETWDDLIDLSDRIVADGGTPWCFQWSAGFASGFVGSDFLESLVLRTGGLDAYDAWVSGEAAFTSPAVLEAGRVGSELLFSPGYVRGGPEVISAQDWAPVMTRLLQVDPLTGAEGPQCWLVNATSQMVDLLGPDTEFGPGGELGVDVDFFVLPPMGEGATYVASTQSGSTNPYQDHRSTTAIPTTGGGSVAIALSDRPEIRALMSYMASPSWGRAWATHSGVGEGFFSVNRRFVTAAYRGDREQADVDVRMRIHELIREALDAGFWRWDASDLMPHSFSTWTDAYVPGPFWQGMIDWADRVAPIEEILADIEAARPR